MTLRRAAMEAESLARRIFEACMAERLLNDIRGWDRREWKDGEWDNIVAGLTEPEKAKWRRVAARLSASLEQDK